MSTSVIAVGHNYVELPDFSAAFARAKDWFGGDIPELSKIWNSGDYYTPAWHFVDAFVF